jgi:polyribonucleotide nucleotidyltransferase
MSVATASGAVSTQHHRPTQEQIRLAQLIDDKKHDQPEVQEIVRKVLDVVANSSTDDVLLALFDCDYDYERAVALLIEKGHEVASEWRTATNHKLTRKQQQQKVATTKNGHGEFDENGQQRGNGKAFVNQLLINIVEGSICSLR